MDKIFIDDLRLFVKVGVTETEREISQELRFDVILWLDLDLASQTDRIANTVNYATIRRQIAVAAACQTHCLLESLANQILNCLLFDKRITRVALTIRKLKIWDNGVPGVTIYRRQTKT